MLNRLVAVLTGILAFAGLASADVYGTVHVTNAAGLVRVADRSMPDDVQAISIDGIGGISWSSTEAAWTLESSGPEGANLHRRSNGEWALAEGRLEVAADSQVSVRVAGVLIRMAGWAVLKHVPDVESEIRILDGIASAHGYGRTIALSALDFLRISAEGGISTGRLLPPPHVAAPPEFGAAPLHLTAELTDDKILAGAILVECSERRLFWTESHRFLFRPGVPLILSDLPGGEFFVRVSTINRAGMGGRPTPVFKTTVLTGPPTLTGRTEIHTRMIQGRLEPPVRNASIRWDRFRTVSDDQGGFEFRPDLPLGLTIGDLCVDVGGREMCIEEPLVFLSDPDRMTYLLPVSDESHRPLLFSRVSSIRLRNSSQRFSVRMNGIHLSSTETWILTAPAIPQTLQVDREGTPFEVSILQDADGPRILNVALESRGTAERFYVLADVLDLGIGLRLPAKAVFESDAGERVDVPLEKVSEIRLEGRAAMESPRKNRSRVWWVRVEADDLLGNRSMFEKTVYHKRQKKFQSVGLKDLVRIWKNKL